MEEKDLLAPEDYNMVMEVEQYAQEKDKKALIYVDDQGNRKEVTYATLMANVNKIGNILLENGLKKGDKILVSVPRIFEAYEVYLAGLKTGIIIVPSSPMFTTEDLQYRVTHGEIDAVVAYAEFTEPTKRIQGCDDISKVSIAKEVERWNLIDGKKESACQDLAIKPQSRNHIAYLPPTSLNTRHPTAAVHTRTR